MLLTPQLDSTQLKGKNIFLDNDFLGSIFADAELLEQSLKVLNGFLIISEFTRIEFLRDASRPDVKKNREEFVGSLLFSPFDEHNIIFQEVKANALALSHLYAHNGRPGVSLADLLLAGTMMYYQNSILVTGNKKDFPSFLFNTIGVLNFEQNNGTMRAISAITFNAEKLAECQARYDKMTAAHEARTDGGG
jgi:predicted nucleic acid-binding protein